MFEIADRDRSLARQTGRSASTILMFSVLRVFLALGTTALLARFVSPADHGLFAMVLPVLLVASGLSEFGLAQAVVQQERVTHKLVTTLFWINLALGIALMSIVAVLGPYAAAFYGKPRVNGLFLWLCPYVLLIVLNTQLVAILRRQMRIRQIEVISFVATILAACAAVLMAVSGHGVKALIVQLLLQPATSFVGLVMLVRWVPSSPLKVDFHDARAALKFGGYLAAERLLGEMGRNLQLVLIGRFFSDIQLAFFHRSSAIAQMPQRRLGAPLLGAFLPALSRLQQDGSGFEALFLRVLSRSNLILIPIGAVLITIPEVVTAILLGPSWSAAAPILQLLGVLPIFAMSLTCLAQALVACGKSRELFYFRSVSFTLLLATMLFASSFGMAVMISAYLAMLILGQGSLLLWVTLRHTPLTLKGVGRQLIADIGFAMVLITPILVFRAFTEFTEVIDAAALIFWILGVFGLRVGMSGALRHDIVQALRPSRAVP